MSTQLTGYLSVPGLHGFLAVREDAAKVMIGATILDVAALADVAGEASQFVPASGKILTLSNSLTLAGTDGTVMTFPSTSATLARTDAANTFTGNQTGSAWLTATNVGTVTTAGTTAAEEHGDGIHHITKLTMTAFAVGTSGDAENLAIGAKFYTFPAGAIAIDEVTISGGITAAVDNTAQTPEVGIGTTIGTGAVAVLSSTMENVVDGGAAGATGDAALVAPDVAGTTFNKANLSTIRPIIKTSGGLAHDIFFNVAVAWADVAAAGAVTFTGVVVIKWRKIS